MTNKRICILTSVHLVFDDRIFHKEAKTLAMAGYDVTLIAQHNKNETVDGIKIIALPKSKNKIERFLKTDFLLYKKALQQKADIYHFHDPELIPWAIKLKRKIKAKIIYDVHEHYPNAIVDKYWIPKIFRTIVSKIFSLFEKFFVSFLDVVIYTTPIVEKRYKKMGICTERIENYPLIKLSDSFKRHPQNNIIYLGGATKIRGTIELLKAFALVIKKHPEWKLYLIGKITPKIFALEVDKLISNLAIKENVKLISWVSYEEKEKYSSLASIGIVTYLPFANNMSCLPNKLFDYMLVELPVVASNFPLYREVVEGSSCGICIDPTKPEEIAKTIEYLIEHPNEAKKMGENGRKAVLEKYNWENEGKKLLEVYKKLLNYEN